MQMRDFICPFSVNRKMHLSSADKAERPNTPFAVQFSAPPASTLPPLDEGHRESFSFGEVSSLDICKRLCGLEVCKAVGVDMIGNRPMKECTT